MSTGEQVSTGEQGIGPESQAGGSAAQLPEPTASDLLAKEQRSDEDIDRWYGLASMPADDSDPEAPQ